MAEPSVRSRPIKPRSGKARKNTPIIIVLITVIVIVAAACYILFFWGNNNSNTGNGVQNNLISVNETQVQSTIGSFSPNVTLYINHPEFTGNHAANQQMILVEPYTHIGLSGTQRIIGIVAKTPGFVLNKTTPALPFTLPNSPDEYNPNYASLTMTFDTPSTQYTGPFEYTVYMDYSP